MCFVGQAASLCGFEISGLEGSGGVVACNGVYIPDKSAHNGQPVFVHVCGHRFMYFNAKRTWMITDLRSDFHQDVGFAHTEVSGSFSPVLASRGGWVVHDGTTWVPCSGVTVGAISG